MNTRTKNIVCMFTIIRNNKQHNVRFVLAENNERTLLGHITCDTFALNGL